MSSGENLTINDSPIINSPLTSSPILSAPVSAPLTSSPSNVRYSSGLYYNGVKYEWGEYVPADALCFSAKQANSRIRIEKNGSPSSVSFETSTDGINWSDYTISTTINLTNIGDKIYFRNKSETDTTLSTGTTNYYYFAMGGRIDGHGNINYLLNKNSTTTLSNYCYAYLFKNCVPLATSPELPSTTITDYCYYNMFQNCTNLTKAPSLPAINTGISCYYSMFYGCSLMYSIPSLLATSFKTNCCYQMFYGCSRIAISTTQTGTYQTPYRIPKTGTGTVETNALQYMFSVTGGTFTGTPSINTTYYTSNTVV